MIMKLYRQYKEMIWYVIVGGLTTVVSLVSYYLCVHFFLNPMNPLELQIANVISWVCAVLFAYVANRKYVFESHETRKLYEFLKFTGARISTLIIDMLSMAMLVSILNINDKVAKIIVQFIVLILNYIFSKFFVFKSNN